MCHYSTVHFPTFLGSMTCGYLIYACVSVKYAKLIMSHLRPSLKCSITPPPNCPTFFEIMSCWRVGRVAVVSRLWTQQYKYVVLDSPSSVKRKTN